MTDKQTEKARACLTERDIDTLKGLDAACQNYATVYGPCEDWVRTMDAGGTNGSHHSATLQKLWRYGLAERQKNGTVLAVGRKSRIKGSDRYRITAAGRAAIAKAEGCP